MIFMLNFGGDIELGLLWSIDSLEWINWCLKTSGISQLYLIQVGPVFVLLFQKILRLASWRFIVVLLHGPVKLVSWMTGEFGKLLAVDSENLVSKFDCILFDHFLDSSLFKHSSVHSDGVQTLERKSQNTGLSIFNSSLAIGVTLKVLLKLLLLLKVVLLSFVNQQTL